MPNTDHPTTADDDLTMGLLAEQQRLWRRMLNYPTMVRLACETRVGTTPCDVVLTERTHKLLRYRRETPAVYAEPLLLCYALVNRPYILDLQPDKSVVQQYLKRGFDVYLIDWGSPASADRVLTLGDYVCGFLKAAIDFVRHQHRRETVHLLGYCMGGTMAALFSALNPILIQTLTLLAAPIDFDRRESLLDVWTDPRHFDVDAMIDAYGNCPAWFLQTCFMFMNPIQNLLEKPLALYEQLDHPENASTYFALERWINDNVPVAGETFRAFVKNFYQRNQLVKGELRLGDRPVDLGRIVCPLLLLTATNDHLVAPASTEGIRPHVGSRDIQSMEIAAGHVGMVVSSRAQRSFWPRATQWLGERSTSVAGGRLGDRPNI
jgi:polyhydroxyalkanoate synthase